jgi:hypothetical protein
MSIFKKVGNWLTEFGNRKAPKKNSVELEHTGTTKGTLSGGPGNFQNLPKTLKPYQVVQRYWDQRLKAAMSNYSWLSYRWFQYEPGMRVRKKTRRVLNTDGTIKAIAVGLTYRRGMTA